VKAYRAQAGDRFGSLTRLLQAAPALRALAAGGTNPEALKADLQAVAALLRRGLTNVFAAQSTTVNPESGWASLLKWNALLDRLAASEAGHLLSYAALHAAVAALPVPALLPSTVEQVDASHGTEVGEPTAPVEMALLPAVKPAASEISPAVPRTPLSGGASSASAHGDVAIRATDTEFTVLTCSTCGSDELTLVRTVSSGRVRRAVRGARFDLQCDRCNHVTRVDEKGFERFNPFLAFERLQRATGSSESA
jgi:hypothetical protein